MTQIHRMNEEKDNDDSVCSSSPLLPRPNIPELYIVESVKNKAQSFFLVSSVAGGLKNWNVPSALSYTDAVMPASMNHHHLPETGAMQSLLYQRHNDPGLSGSA